MRTTTKLCLAAAFAGLASQPAYASDKSSGSFQVGARIPVVCNLDTRSFVVEEEASIVRGAMFEACNTNRGFQVFATHRTLEDNERVRVRYGFEQSELHATGFSFVAMRSGARYGAVPVQIETLQLNQPISISFSLTAV
ncbi:MAG: hypothetical protein AAGK02_04325 [Pseudomonadota bacterium]